MCYFSIIIPTYNRSKTIERAIQSVLDQTFTDWELIVIDDGSTDDTKNIVERFTDPRIQYFFQENAERSAARNNGIERSKGDWICFLDSDDLYLSHHLQTLYDGIEGHDHKIGLYLTGHLIQDGDKQLQHPLINVENNIFKEIWIKFILINSVTVYRSILELDKFIPAYSIWEDTHLWLRIAGRYPVIQLPEYTVLQTISEDSKVKTSLEQVRIKTVQQYITAVLDFKNNYSFIWKGKLTPADFKQYIDSKYRMFLYSARQNKQLGVALRIWFTAIINSPSVYLISEFFKIFMNKINLGIHER